MTDVIFDQAKSHTSWCAGGSSLTLLLCSVQHFAAGLLTLTGCVVFRFGGRERRGAPRGGRGAAAVQCRGGSGTGTDRGRRTAAGGPCQGQGFPHPRRRHSVYIHKLRTNEWCSLEATEKSLVAISMAYMLESNGRTKYSTRRVCSSVSLV